MRFFTDETISAVRAGSLLSEQTGTISPDVLQIIYQHRLFKLFVPIELGGTMQSLPDAITIFEEASYIDGSFGWLVTIGSGGGYFAAMFDPQAGRQLFSPASAVVAGSGHLSGSAVATDGGYLASGSWRYCSGADYATIFTANCILPSGHIRSSIFTPDQVSISRDWAAYGLKATGSHTIHVDSVFVPEEMTFDIAHGQRQYADPIYDYPFMPFAEASFAAVNIGICRHFLDEASESANAYTADAVRYKTVKQLIQTQRNILDDKAEAFHKALQHSWDIAATSTDDTAEVSRTAKDAAATALSCAQQVYPHLGLQVTVENSALNRSWRDLHVASQHILLK